MTLWRFNHVTGCWRCERSDILTENRAAYLTAYEAQEPDFTFTYAKRKPRQDPPSKLKVNW